MKESITITITCPKCDKPLPNKIDNIKIKNTDELIGFICESCSHKITSEDITVIDDRIKREVKSFSDSLVKNALKNTNFKFK